MLRMKINRILNTNLIKGFGIKLSEGKTLQTNIWIKKFRSCI